MQTSRFQAITARFSRHSLRTSFRRSSSASSNSSSSSSGGGSDRNSLHSQASSPVSTIDGSSSTSSGGGGITHRQQQKSRTRDLGMDDGDEKELNLLEPRPAGSVRFCSLEERMGSF